MVEKIVKDGAEYFGIKAPAVRISRGQAGNYRPDKHLITLPKKDEAAYRKMVITHEMAHAVDFKLNKVRKGRSFHDRVFFNILVDLVNLAYDDVKDYPWHAEYRTIYRWACARGYSTPGLNWHGQPIVKRSDLVKAMCEESGKDMTKDDIRGITALAAAFGGAK
jgi:predicted SprT family Zn-dependent metalloprotease